MFRPARCRCAIQPIKAVNKACAVCQAYNPSIQWPTILLTRTSQVSGIAEVHHGPSSTYVKVRFCNDHVQKLCWSMHSGGGLPVIGRCTRRESLTPIRGATQQSMD